MLAKGQNRTRRFLKHRRRIIGGLAISVDEGAIGHLDAFVISDADFAMGQFAGGKIDNNRLVIPPGNTDSDRIGDKFGHFSAKGRNNRIGNHIHKMDRNEAFPRALLGPMANSADVMAVIEGNNRRT